jgi:flagellar basal body-associated protein FliL
VNAKILAVIVGIALLGVGAISIWIIVKEGSPANVPRGKFSQSSEATSNQETPAKHAPVAHKPAPKSHKH